MNANLREAIVDIDWEKDSFDLRYITLRQPAVNSETKVRHGIDAVPGLPDLSDRSSLELLSEEQLNIDLRDAQSAAKGAPNEVALLFTPAENGAPYLFLENGRRALIGRISGSQIAELYRRHKSRLFALNLRNYIGDNATNRGIRETATQQPDEFFFFNNGLSALANSIRPDSDEPRKVICESFSVINGAQTIRSLAKAQTNNRDALRDVQVLIRVSQLDRKRSQREQAFLDNVTKFNNTQNAIKLSDFRSNDPIQEDLASRFAQLKARSGKKIIYKNKRTGDQDRTKVAIPMEEFTKTVFSFLWGPPDVFGGTSYLFDPSMEGGYSKLYGDDSGAIKVKLLTDEFNRLAGIWFLCEYAKAAWKRESKHGAEALERRWLFFYALGKAICLMHEMIEADFDKALMTLADPTWIESSDKKAVAFRGTIDKFCDMAFRALKKVYVDASRRSDFRHRNWFRSAMTLREIDSQLDDYCSLMKHAANGYKFG